MLFAILFCFYQVAVRSPTIVLVAFRYSYSNSFRWIHGDSHALMCMCGWPDFANKRIERPQRQQTEGTCGVTLYPEDKAPPGLHIYSKYIL